jgi:uncharacterized protein (DUF3084 family)
MTEITHETEHTKTPTEHEHESPLASLAERLRAEHARLTELAEALQRGGRDLAEHEARLAERERQLHDQGDALDRRGEELERREQELRRLAAQVEEAETRLAEVAEREAVLARLGNELAERFAQGS